MCVCRAPNDEGFSRLVGNIYGPGGAGEAGAPLGGGPLGGGPLGGAPLGTPVEPDSDSLVIHSFSNGYDEMKLSQYKKNLL